MNYIILIIVGVIGIALGRRFAVRKENLFAEQSKQKAENKEKILRFFREREKVVNDDVEKLLGVSDATTERYLDELEKEGKIEQHGKTGQSVFYSLVRKD